MNSFLLDAPVLVARYALGPGYLLADQLLALAAHGRVCCSILSLAEVMAALVRLRRRGRLTPVLFAAANLQFRLEVIQSAAFTKLTVSSPRVEAALALIDTHRLAGYAGILLRMCLDQVVQVRAAGHDLVLVSSNKRLLQVARMEGMLTFNPETRTQSELDILLGP
jgi:predicted nucleic acid-binding protein